MADRSQPAQRPVYHASAYKPDNVRDYHDDYIQTLSFYATDVPVHAQKSASSTTVKSSKRNTPRRKNEYGHLVDAGSTIEMQYNSLYPGDLQHSYGTEESFLVQKQDQRPRVRTPPGNRQGKIPSKFVVEPSSSPAAAAQCPPRPNGFVVPGTTTYIPNRMTSGSRHLPTAPGTRRNLCPAKSEAEAMGNEFFRRKEYKEAAKAYAAAIKSDPRNATLYRNRAAVFATLGLWKDCAKDTAKVVELMPNNRKAMLRHKSVVDFMTNFNTVRGPGYDRQNLTIVNLLTPEEFTANLYSERLTFKKSFKGPSIKSVTEPKPMSWYEQGSPVAEPLKWAQSRGSRYFWESQLTSPESRKKHKNSALMNPGDSWTVNPSPTLIKYSV